MNLCKFAVWVLFLSSLWAQDTVPVNPQPPDLNPPKTNTVQRPRIGLVLEGGGALGLAHVGVIKWLEANRIPVDAIAGTSMGALVGGIYATGESPEEIETLIRGIPWDEVLRGTTPYQDRSFRRKEDKRNYPAFEMGLKRGKQLPSSFTSGQQVGLILDWVGLPYSEMKSFDDLPIPFRSVATDLRSQESYVFDHGSLALAMRASMSLPAILTPVRDGSHVLVDGGLLDNLPVDLARQMGVDIVIAVHLETAELDPAKSISSLELLERSLRVNTALNEKRSMDMLGEGDILLTAEVQGFNATDYELFDQLEAEGWLAAERQKALLERLHVTKEEEWQQILKVRNDKQKRPVPPEFVDVADAKGTPIAAAKGDVQKGLEHELSGLKDKPIDQHELDEKMMAVTGLGRFARAGYREVVRDQRGVGLAVEAEEKDYAPPILRPTLVIDGSDYKNVLFEVGARITWLDVGGFGSEWRNDLIAGSEYGLKSEFFHPFNAYTGWFVSTHATADSSPFYVYQRNKILGEYRDRLTGGGVDVGYTFGRSSEVRVGYETGYQKISEDIGVPVAPAVRGRYGVASLKYQLDRFDDPVLPRNGVRLESTFHFYDKKPGTSDTVPTAEMRLGFAQRTSEKSSLLLLASGGTSFSTHNTGFPPFSLGGPLRLGAYGTNEFLTNQYFLLQPALLYKLRELSPLLRQNVYLLTMYEAAKPYGQPPGATKVAQDATVGLLFQTVFGPVFFGGAIGDSQHRKAFFQVGKFF